MPAFSTNLRPTRRSFALLRLKPRLLLACIVGTTLLAGCDETFSPIQPSDLRLSVFGYLDPSADTQWIRVMPIRPVAPTSPDVLGARVSIENLETGRVIELRDSLFRFTEINDSIGSEGIFVHNFWTTEPVDTGATYRFFATLEGGKPSEATVAIPADYAVEVWIGQGRSADLIRLTGVKHLAFVGVITQYSDGCGSGVNRILSPIPETHSDEYTVTIRARSAIRIGCGPSSINKRDLWIVVSGSEWPEGLEHSAGALGLPDVPSNISNSVGFLGGVLTKLLPYESCRIGGFEPPEYCRLRYDTESASMRGTVRNACGMEIEGANVTVELREVGIEPPANYTVRSTNRITQSDRRISGYREHTKSRLSRQASLMR